MQKHLRIDYRLSYLPYFFAFVLFLVLCFFLSLLHLHVFVRIVFLLAIAGAITWNLRLLYLRQCVLDFDGQCWRIHEEQHSHIVDFQRESFISRYFLVLVFNVHGGGKQFRFYFSLNNCSTTEFRALCRLSLAR